jgi:hypothetical protein
VIFARHRKYLSRAENRVKRLGMIPLQRTQMVDAVLVWAQRILPSWEVRNHLTSVHQAHLAHAIRNSDLSR